MSIFDFIKKLVASPFKSWQYLMQMRAKVTDHKKAINAGVSLPADFLKRAKKWAAQNHKSLSQVVKEMLIEKIEAAK